MQPQRRRRRRNCYSSCSSPRLSRRPRRIDSSPRRGPCWLSTCRHLRIHRQRALRLHVLEGIVSPLVELDALLTEVNGLVTPAKGMDSNSIIFPCVFSALNKLCSRCRQIRLSWNTGKCYEMLSTYILWNVITKCFVYRLKHFQFEMVPNNYRNNIITDKYITVYCNNVEFCYFILLTGPDVAWRLLFLFLGASACAAFCSKFGS